MSQIQHFQPEAPKQKSRLPYLGLLALIILGIIYYVFVIQGTVTNPSAIASTNTTSLATTTINASQRAALEYGMRYLNQSLVNTFMGNSSSYRAYNLTNSSYPYTLPYETYPYPFRGNVTGGWYVVSNLSSNSAITTATELLFQINMSQDAEEAMYNGIINQTSYLNSSGKFNISNGSVNGVHYESIVYYPTPYFGRPSRSQIWVLAWKGNTAAEVEVSQEAQNISKSGLDAASTAIIKALSIS